MRSPTLEYYDCEARFYDQLRWGRPSGRSLDKWQGLTLLQLLHDLAGSTVLEIGSGTGRMTLRVLPHCFRLIAMDFSKRMMDQLGRKVATESQSRLTRILATAPAVPLPDAAVDAAYLVNTLQLIEESRALFLELHRVLKPGGRIVFNYPNLSSIYFPYGLYRNWIGRARNRNEGGYRRTRWFKRAWIMDVMGVAGFRIVEEVGQPVVHSENGSLRKWPKVWCPSVFVKALRIP